MSSHSRKLTIYLAFPILLIVLTSCVTQRASTLIGGDYDASKNETSYFVLPYGSVILPGKWEKTHYVAISRQQFFKNKDSVSIAIAFGRYNSYEFNANGAYKGYHFITAFYEWDSRYFVDTHGLQRQVLECDSSNNFMTYRIFGEPEKGKFDTYFLVGEKNGNTSNFSISYTNKWSEPEKMAFLKNLFLSKKD